MILKHHWISPLIHPFQPDLRGARDQDPAWELQLWPETNKNHHNYHPLPTKLEKQNLSFLPCCLGYLPFNAAHLVQVLLRELTGQSSQLGTYWLPH